jgi:hypothetical protein
MRVTDSYLVEKAQQLAQISPALKLAACTAGPCHALLLQHRNTLQQLHCNGKTHPQQETKVAKPEYLHACST